MTSAAERWRTGLEAWAIPPRILEAAPESPWGFPVELFASRADAAVAAPSRSNLRALEALPGGGSVLDVGCGAGAASLPLAGRAASLIGVDAARDMLDAFAERAERAGVAFRAVRGRWPEAADRVEPVDVVVCHHVFWNAPDLDPFVRRMADHARHRVVVELTRRHPTSDLNDLWLEFHGLIRPTGPTVDDAVAVIREAGFDPDREDWTAPRGGGFARKGDLVAWVRRRLCLPADRDAEIEASLRGRGSLVERDGLFGFEPREVVTLWWPPAAGPP